METERLSGDAKVFADIYFAELPELRDIATPIEPTRLQVDESVLLTLRIPHHLDERHDLLLILE